MPEHPSDAILYLPLGFTNVYGVTTTDGLVLIDAGPDYEGAWEELQELLHAYGFGAAAVRAVLLTHGHSDHAGLARRWQQAGAAVMAGRGEEALLCRTSEQEEVLAANLLRFWQESGVPEDLLLALQRPRAVESNNGDGQTKVRQGEARPGRWPARLRMTSVTPDRLLEDGEAIVIGGVTLRAVLCPGHTPAHVAYLYQGQGILFSGDHVLPYAAPIQGIHFLGDSYGNRLRGLPAYLRSLAKVRALEVSRILPGHQEAIDDPADVIDRHLRHHEQRARRVLQALQQHSPQTAYEVMAGLWPHLSPRQTRAALAEVMGHLDLLEERGQVTQDRHNGWIVYRAV